MLIGCMLEVGVIVFVVFVIGLFIEMQLMSSSTKIKDVDLEHQVAVNGFQMCWLALLALGRSDSQREKQ